MSREIVSNARSSIDNKILIVSPLLTHTLVLIPLRNYAIKSKHQIW
jgi:hypothetical protein